MKNPFYRKLPVALIIALVISGCDGGEQQQKAPAAVVDSDINSEIKDRPQQESEAVKVGPVAKAGAEPAATADDSKYKTIEWTELMPQEDLDALLNPPDYVTEVEDGSEEDQLSSQITNTLRSMEANDPYQQALVSTKVVESMNGQTIRIPGFIVPLEFGDDKRITSFFLVPFFGACIHVPPPPPNQMIYVAYPQGLELLELYDAFWLTGVLKTSITENEMGTAAYSLELHDYKAYY